MNLFNTEALEKIVRSAVVKALTGDMMEFYRKSDRLPDNPTISECMEYLKIKDRKTFNTKREEFKLKVKYNKAKNNLMTFDKTEIMQLYVSENDFF